MRAIVYDRYGPPDVLRLEEVEKPIPKSNEILIRVHATPVNYGDMAARNFQSISPRKFTMPLPFWLPMRIVFGLRKPKKRILGSEFAGEIETVGKDVQRLRIGDQVFGYTGIGFGAYAEYLCMPEDGCLSIKPADMTYEEAAVIPSGGITAIHILSKVEIKRGDKVLVNGASGGIGSVAVQLARSYGAEVTGVCGTPRLELVKSLGANIVIDYTQEDFTRGGETYNLIVDVLGKSSWSRCKRVLRENGRYLLVSFKMKQVFQMLWTKITGGRKVICALSPQKIEDLVRLKELIEAGKIKAVIDKSFPLAQAAEAHGYVEAGQKKGHVVITLKTNNRSE